MELEELPPSMGRCLRARATFVVKDLPPVPEAAKPLLLHFHPYQNEYFDVQQGSATVSLEGKEHVLSPSDPEFTIPRMATHSISPTPGSNENLVLIASSEETNSRKTRLLDTAFFENWWQYQTELLKYNLQPDIIQILAVSGLSTDASHEIF